MATGESECIERQDDVAEIILPQFMRARDTCLVAATSARVGNLRAPLEFR